jgi:hypothetical protein
MMEKFIINRKQQSVMRIKKGSFITAFFVSRMPDIPVSRIVL